MSTEERNTNMKRVLAERLRRLADLMESAETEDKQAEVGIDLSIIKSDWERLCFGQLDPLTACKDRELAVAA